MRRSGRSQGLGERCASEMGLGGRSPSRMRVLGGIEIGFGELEIGREKERDLSGEGESQDLVDPPRSPMQLMGKVGHVRWVWVGFSPE